MVEFVQSVLDSQDICAIFEVEFRMASSSYDSLWCANHDVNLPLVALLFGMPSGSAIHSPMNGLWNGSGVQGLPV